MRQKYRKRKDTKFWPGFSCWNFEAEAGDLMQHDKHGVVRLVESRGRNKRDAGELSYIKLRPPLSLSRKAHIEVDEQGEIWWVE